MTADQLDNQILDFVKHVAPSGAYLMGFNDHAGKLFVPTKRNIDGALRQVRELRSRAKTDLQKKVLDSLETTLMFDEPQPVLDDIVGAIFSHLVKEGVNDEHMLSLMDYASKGIDVRMLEQSASYGFMPNNIVLELRSFANRLDENGNLKQ